MRPLTRLTTTLTAAALLPSLSACEINGNLGTLNLPPDSLWVVVRPTLAAVPSYVPLATAELRLIERNSQGLDVTVATQRIPVSGTTTLDQSTLTFPLRIAGARQTFGIAEIELFGPGQFPRVEWSVRTDTIRQKYGTSATRSLTFGRGPLANLAVNVVSLDGPPARTLAVGDTMRVTWSSATTGTLYVESTDRAVATIEDERLVRAMRPGTARIVGAAGVHADTIVVTVVAAQQR